MKEEKENFHAWLLEEIRAWRGEGLIDEGLASALTARYQGGAGDGGHSRLVTIFAIMGAVLVGVGAILFVAAHWEGIRPAGKVLILLSLVVGAYAAAYEGCMRDEKAPRVGAALLLLGGLLYGASIAQVAQIFNINAHFPNGFLAWGLGLLPMVYLCRSSPLLVLAMVTLAIWNGAEQVAGDSALPWMAWAFGETIRTWNPAFWVLAVGSCLPAVLRFPSPTGAALMAMMIYAWMFVPTVALSSRGSGVLPCLFAYALLLIAFGRWARSRGELGIRLTTALDHLGVAALLFSTFFLCYPWGAKEFLQEVSRFSGGPVGSWGVPLVVHVGALGLAGWLSSTLERREERLMCLGVAALAGVTLASWWVDPGKAPTALLFNAVFLTTAIGAIYAGVTEGRGRLVNLGVAAFSCWVIARYFQWFWDLLDRGIFFVVGGSVLLYGALKMERVRKSLQEQVAKAAGEVEE